MPIRRTADDVAAVGLAQERQDSRQLVVTRRDSDLVRSLATALNRGDTGMLASVIRIGVRHAARELTPTERDLFVLGGADAFILANGDEP